MNFNFRAVSKKERIIKTLVLGIPFTLISSLLFSFVLRAAQALIRLNIIYYIILFGYSILIGRFVKKVGKGTSYEFLVIAGIFAFFGHSLAEFLALYGGSLSFLGFSNALAHYVKTFLWALPSATNNYSLVVKSFAVAIAVQEAITVRNGWF